MSAYVPDDLRRQVRKRYSDCCAYCQTAEKLSVAVFEIEHVVPRSCGGQTVLENLCLACPMCNRYKADRLVAVAPHMENTVPLFSPSQDSWADHFAWSEDATKIIGLTLIGEATIYTLRMNRPTIVRLRRMWVVMGEHPPMLP
jgi:hypothetical protein